MDIFHLKIYWFIFALQNNMGLSSIYKKNMKSSVCNEIMSSFICNEIDVVFHFQKIGVVFYLQKRIEVVFHLQ